MLRCAARGATWNERDVGKIGEALLAPGAVAILRRVGDLSCGSRKWRCGLGVHELYDWRTTHRILSWITRGASTMDSRVSSAVSSVVCTARVCVAPLSMGVM